MSALTDVRRGPVGFLVASARAGGGTVVARLALISGVLLLGSLLAPLTTTISHASEVVKSENDSRQYEHFSLPNGLDVLVISDPLADKAAAALDVNIGSGSNPPGREGLAHFLEHLLFLGTERYPQPGEYKDFINAHGGSDNAYTSFDHTNYFFNIDSAYLEPALDRFAQFFVAPLFNEEYVGRERQVVHSEYTSSLRSDGRRVHEAQRQAFNPRHPRSRFSVGTAVTLADRDGASIRDELIAFYRKHYSAGLMKLVVLGREPPAVLKHWVERRFSAVPATGVSRLITDEPLFEPGRLPARVNAIPVRDTRRISFLFPIDEVSGHFRTKPIRLLGDLIGHEGKGSLLSALKSRGWAQALSAGGGIDDPRQATFEVDIALTEEGVAHAADIGELLFATIALVREEGVVAWRYAELAKLAGLDFRFAETVDPGRYTRWLANALHEYPPADVLRGFSLMESFQPELTSQYLSRLNPDNVLVTVVAKDLPTRDRSPFYQTEYQIDSLPAKWHQRWSSPGTYAELQLPPVNDFIPQNLSMVAHDGPNPEPVPRRLAHGEKFEHWHATDVSFGLPHSAVFAAFKSKLANRSARDAVLLRLFLGLVNDQLTEFVYPAELAGMRYSLYPHIRGFSLRLTGYSDRESRLLERIIRALKSPNLKGDRFEVVRAELGRRYRNAAEQSSYELGLDSLRHLLLDPHWSAEQRLAELQTVSLEELRGFATELLASLRVVTLTHGNLDVSRAKQLAHTIETAFEVPGSAPEAAPFSRLVKLLDGANFRRELNTRHHDDAALVYLQMGTRRVEDRAFAALVAQLIESPFFDSMRTEKKLGYVVFAYGMTLRRVPGLAFIVQSPTASASALDGYISQFIADNTLITELTAEDFERNKKALISRILRRENQLLDRSSRYWLAINRPALDFDARERLARAVNALELEPFKTLYSERVRSKRRRALTVLAKGSVTKDRSSPAGPGHSATAVAINDDAAFTAGSPKHPN